MAFRNWLYNRRISAAAKKDERLLAEYNAKSPIDRIGIQITKMKKMNDEIDALLVEQYFILQNLEFLKKEHVKTSAANQKKFKAGFIETLDKSIVETKNAIFHLIHHKNVLEDHIATAGIAIEAQLKYESEHPTGLFKRFKKWTQNAWKNLFEERVPQIDSLPLTSEQVQRIETEARDAEQRIKTVMTKDALNLQGKDKENLLGAPFILNVKKQADKKEEKSPSFKITLRKFIRLRAEEQMAKRQAHLDEIRKTIRIISKLSYHHRTSFLLHFLKLLQDTPGPTPIKEEPNSGSGLTERQQNIEQEFKSLQRTADRWQLAIGDKKAKDLKAEEQKLGVDVIHNAELDLIEACRNAGGFILRHFYEFGDKEIEEQWKKITKLAKGTAVEHGVIQPDVLPAPKPTPATEPLKQAKKSPVILPPHYRFNFKPVRTDIVPSAEAAAPEKKKIIRLKAPETTPIKPTKKPPVILPPGFRFTFKK